MGSDRPRPDDGYYDASSRAPRRARDAQRPPPGARVAKRALLFTNRDDPLRPGEDGRELVSQWREFRDVHRVDVRLFTLPRAAPPRGDGDDRHDRDDERVGRDGITARVLGLGREDRPVRTREFDPSVFYHHLVDRDDDDEEDAARDAAVGRDRPEPSNEPSGSAYTGGHELVACSADRVERLTLDFRRSSRRRRGSRATTLRFGAGDRDAVAVRLHAPLAEARRPKPVALHSRDLSEVYADTVFVSAAVGEYVAPEHLTRKCVEYGGSRVVLTRAEIAEAKRACGVEGAHVLGFRPRDDVLRRWAQTARPARFMTRRTSRRNRGAAAFAALVDAMARRRVVAVVAFARVGERDAGVRCAALVPSETEDGQVNGLHVVYLPFADDVRHPERAHDRRRPPARARREDEVVGSRGATEAQIRAAEEAVDALAVHSYDPSDISNPTLARHYRALESQALNRAWTAGRRRDRRDGTAGEDELAALGAREPAEAFKAAAYGANHDEEVAAATAAGAAGARGTKRKTALGGGLGEDAVDYRALAQAGDLDRVVAARLKEYCKANGLPTTGVKATLVERVAAHALGA